MIDEGKILNDKPKVKLVDEIDYLSNQELVPLFYLGENN